MEDEILFSPVDWSIEPFLAFIKWLIVVNNLTNAKVKICLENLGCTAGTPENALNYIARNGGLDTEVSYPYVGKVRRTILSPDFVNVTFKTWVNASD